jgi:general secretion pathway protein A
MYERFYGLTKNPFFLTPDPSFLVMTEQHCNVKAGLMYAILAGKGFTVLTGDAGTGKTTLLRSVINSIPADTISSSLVLNPDLTPDEFTDLTVSDFGLGGGMTKPERLRKLHEYLIRVHEAGKRAVLFVDEAHRLSVETLEEIRLLTNFETESEKLLQIVLVGQDELDELLDRRELRQLKQRVEVRLRVGPLSPESVEMYIDHRWRCTATTPHPFSREAIRLISDVSCGIPRLINSVCDNALLVGFAGSSRIITPAHVLEASQDLRLTINTEKLAVQNIEHEQQVETMDLRLPSSVSNGYSHNPLSLLGTYKPKRSWWRTSKVGSHE